MTAEFMGAPINLNIAIISVLCNCQSEIDPVSTACNSYHASFAPQDCNNAANIFCLERHVPFKWIAP